MFILINALIAKKINPKPIYVERDRARFLDFEKNLYKIPSKAIDQTIINRVAVQFGSK